MQKQTHFAVSLLTKHLVTDWGCSLLTGHALMLGEKFKEKLTYQSSGTMLPINREELHVNMYHTLLAHNFTWHTTTIIKPKSSQHGL